MKKYANTIANSMDTLMKSAEYEDLFGDYGSPKETPKPEVCMCEPGESCEVCTPDEDLEVTLDANDASDAKAEDEDDNKAEDKDMKECAAYNIAIESLLTASAALDATDLSDGSTLSLKLASLVSEAKKAMTDKMSADDKAKLKAKEKAAKEKEKAKAQAEKDKAKAKAEKEKAKAKAEKDKQDAKDAKAKKDEADKKAKK